MCLSSLNDIPVQNFIFEGGRNVRYVSEEKPVFILRLSKNVARVLFFYQCKIIAITFDQNPLQRCKLAI